MTRFPLVAVALVLLGCESEASPPPQPGPTPPAEAVEPPAPVHPYAECNQARWGLHPHLQALGDRVEASMKELCDDEGREAPACKQAFLASLNAQVAAVTVVAKRPSGIRQSLERLRAIELGPKQDTLEAPVDEAIARVQAELRPAAPCAHAPAPPRREPDASVLEP
ncbi:MAG: hypothetical protein ACOCV4_05590 [Myxococcota bacterium]